MGIIIDEKDQVRNELNPDYVPYKQNKYDRIRQEADDHVKEMDEYLYKQYVIRLNEANAKHAKLLARTTERFLKRELKLKQEIKALKKQLKNGT